MKKMFLFLSCLIFIFQSEAMDVRKNHRIEFVRRHKYDQHQFRTYKEPTYAKLMHVSARSSLPKVHVQEREIVNTPTSGTHADIRLLYTLAKFGLAAYYAQQLIKPVSAQCNEEDFAFDDPLMSYRQMCPTRSLDQQLFISDQVRECLFRHFFEAVLLQTYWIGF